MYMLVAFIALGLGRRRLGRWSYAGAMLVVAIYLVHAYYAS